MARPGGIDQQGPLRMEPTGQESQRAAGPQEGREETRLEEAPEPKPKYSERQSREDRAGTQPVGPGGRDTAAAEGEAPAGPAVAGRREGRGKWDGADGKGKPRESESGKDLGKPEDAARKPGDQQPGTSREYSRERCQERAEGTEQVEGKYPLEEKPDWRKIPTQETEETNENKIFRGKKETSAGRETEQLSRRPTIRFSIRRRSSPQSLWSDHWHPSPCLFNQLANMGDPDVLEMVQHEGRSPRSGARGGSDTARGAPTAGVGTPRDVGDPAAWSSETFAQSGAPCARQGLHGEQILPGVGGWVLAPHDFRYCRGEPGTSVL